MKITRTSQLSGMTRTLELDVTKEEVLDYATGDMLVQDAFPRLTPDQREFIMTGITAVEWAEMFGDKHGNS